MNSVVLTRAMFEHSFFCGGDKLKDAEKSHTKLFRYKKLVVGGVGISSEIGLTRQ